jgi:hypothetical protein
MQEVITALKHLCRVLTLKWFSKKNNKKRSGCSLCAKTFMQGVNNRMFFPKTGQKSQVVHSVPRTFMQGVNNRMFFSKNRVKKSGYSLCAKTCMQESILTNPSNSCMFCNLGCCEYEK